MPTNIYTTHKKLNETLGIDGIVPELTDAFFSAPIEPQDPNWKYQTGEMNAFYGKKHTDESKRLMSITSKGTQMAEDNPFFGRNHSEESKRKIGAANSINMKRIWKERKENKIK